MMMARPIRILMSRPSRFSGRTGSPGQAPWVAAPPERGLLGWDQRIGAPEIVRAMTRRWISEVPSKMV